MMTSVHPPPPSESPWLFYLLTPLCILGRRVGLTPLTQGFCQ